MRTKNVTYVAAAFSLAFAQAAVAADMPVKMPVKAAPMVVAPYNWSGFFVGIQGGGAWGTVPNAFDVGFGAVTEPDYKTSGALFGGHAGYNWQVGNFVYGVVADIEWANIKGDDGGLGGVTDQLKNDWRGSFRGRLGYSWDRLLVYATGGVAFGDLKYSLIALAPSTGNESVTNTTAGWTVGGGAEYAFLPAWSAFVEYRYTDFGSHSDFFPTASGIAADTISFKYHDSAVRGGISYHFGK
jgi:outer membrane immunogenic protein